MQTLFGDLGDRGRRENREFLGLNHPTSQHHSSREPRGCTKPDIAWESHPQAKDRWIWWNKDGKLLLSVSTVPIPVPKTWSVHPPVTPILIFLMNLDLKAPCSMSQSYRCVTDGLGENFFVAALQMSLPHCSFMSLALPRANEQGKHPKAAEMAPSCGWSPYSYAIERVAELEPVHANPCTLWLLLRLLKVFV